MKHIEIYTDGACSGNPGPGGWGAILRFRTGEKVYEKEISGGEAGTTNNRMELTGLLEALRQLKESCDIDLYSDSQYVINGLEKGWAKGWRKRGWKKADKSPALNPRPLGTAAGRKREACDPLPLAERPRRPPRKRALRPLGRGAKQKIRRKAGLTHCAPLIQEDIMDGALGFNTFEKQDKVLVGLNGGMDAAVTVRILQEQGFAVQAALVHFAGMADDAVETAQNAAKALDVTLHVIEAADTAADELLKFQLLMQTADKLDCRFISTGHYARVEQDADECRLCAPEHAECDQTALLEVLPQEILARLILPLGEFDKESVQEIAQDIGCAE